MQVFQWPPTAKEYFHLHKILDATMKTM